MDGTHSVLGKSTARDGQTENLCVWVSDDEKNMKSMTSVCRVGL